MSFDEQSRPTKMSPGFEVVAATSRPFPMLELLSIINSVITDRDEDGEGWGGEGEGRGGVK